jgi:hypothetical protein
MKFEQFGTVYLKLRAGRAAQDEYLNRIPEDIMDAFFDNTYVNEYDKMVSVLVETLMPEDIGDWLFYFLYEWHPGLSVWVKDKEFVLETTADVLSFMHQEFTWES